MESKLRLLFFQPVCYFFDKGQVIRRELAKHRGNVPQMFLKFFSPLFRERHLTFVLRLNKLRCAYLVC